MPDVDALADQLNPIPRALEALDRQVASWPDLEPDGPMWVTGAGQSEPAARWLAEGFARTRGPAAFVPAGAYLEPAHLPRGGTYLTVSHGLSPHGSLPLEWARRLGRPAWALTARPDLAARRGARVLALPPGRPGGALRVQASALQAAAVAHLLGAPCSPEEARRTLARTAPPATGLHAPAALVSTGADLALTAALRALAWAAREAWGLSVEVFDVLGSAHGPAHVWARRGTPVWAFGDSSAEWMERLKRTLDFACPIRPIDVQVGPAAWFEAFAAGLFHLGRTASEEPLSLDDRWLYAWTADPDPTEPSDP
jgi:hypothetical protein